MYPVESINSRARAEKRWEEDLTPQSIFQDLPTNWKISIGNGKRLGRKWRRNGGIAFVPNRYGEYQTIYNKRYAAKYDDLFEGIQKKYGAPSFNSLMWTL